MNRVLIVYGTTDGHTRNIAITISNELAQASIQADVVEAGTLSPSLDDYAAVIVAASVHVGKYQKPVTQWVREHAPGFGRRPTAFVSVSLGVLRKGNARVAAELDAIVQGFLDETGWTPTVTRYVAGALLYTRYNIFKRWMMRRIVAKAHGDTDISRDYDYTDWDDVRAFAREFGRRLEPAAA